jgi:2'-5' RNA ligase
MQKLAVVYFPKINLDKINNFRKKYDANWQIIPLHITIVSPILDIPENQLIQHVTTIIKDVKPFSIHLTGLTKTFDDCLFLLVREGNDEIMNLHDKLYSGILAPYISIDISFVPHITLGYFGKKDTTIDEKLYNKAYAEAQDLDFDSTCEFDAISVINGDGITPAKIVKTINLHA